MLIAEHDDANLTLKLASSEAEQFVIDRQFLLNSSVPMNNRINFS